MTVDDLKIQLEEVPGHYQVLVCERAGLVCSASSYVSREDNEVWFTATSVMPSK
jgi:hypothetical protein